MKIGLSAKQTVYVLCVVSIAHFTNSHHSHKMPPSIGTQKNGRQEFLPTILLNRFIDFTCLIAYFNAIIFV